MSEKSKLTIAAEIATIIAVLPAGIGVYFAWAAYRGNHPSATRSVASYTGAVMTITHPASYWFLGALLLSIVASVLFFIASRRRQGKSESLEKCKADLIESARRNLEYRGKLEDFGSDAVMESDPLIYPQFIDDRTNGSDRRELQAYFTLVNRGKSEARNMIIDSVEMHGNIVQFTRHRIAAPLLPTREVAFYPDVVTKENNSVSAGWGQDLFHLFYMDYTALGDSTMYEAVKSVRVTYQDSLHNLFEVTCELVLDPSAHTAVRVGNRGPNPVIVTRNHKFRKIARAI